MGIIDILALLKFDNELEIEALVLIQESLDKTKFIFKFIWLGTVFNSFLLKVSQKLENARF